MFSRETQTRQKKSLPTCALTSLVLLVGLMLAVVIFVAFSLHYIFGKDSVEDVTFDPSENTYDDCRSRVTVLPDEALKQNVSRAWSDVEPEAKEPKHEYMQKHHVTSIFMFTRDLLRPANQNSTAAAPAGDEEERTDQRSLYSSLSEAIQILKHGQVTCVRTRYRTHTLLKNISNTQVRFSSFVLGSDRWNVSKSASCLEIDTCFGADVTYYSALKLSSQVLIPPYEVFKVTAAQMDTRSCDATYRLKSNLNCVYDEESNTLHQISALTVEGFWLIFIVSCVIIIFLLLVFVVVKVLKNRNQTVVDTVSGVQNNTYSPAGLLM
ncbi:hypothetical protein LDENG_00132860 [Lucifuga dentata]|nr:hypothetical protein LDENG_00132860 [Lucifuga dentata]